LNYFPSKKFIIIFSSLLVAGGIVWFASAKNTPKSQASGKTLSVSHSTEQKDTDGDGVADWEEVLQGTDPQNPDTNGDGKKDELQTSVATSSPDVSAAINMEMPTQNVIRDFTAYYVATALEDGSAPFNEQTKKFLVQNALPDIKKIKEKLNPYTLSDVLVDEKKSVKEYYNNFGSVAIKYFPAKNDPKNDNELAVLQTLAEHIQKEQLSEEDFGITMQKLRVIRYKYFSAAKDLSQISVPAEVKEIHLGLVNSFYNIALSLEEIALFESDPAIGMVGMQMYGDEINKIKPIMAAAQTLTKKYEIVFNESDPAYPFRIYFQPHS
jgi:hypothetical protein